MVLAEIMFPAATGTLVILASLVGGRVYIVSGNRAIMWLSIGLLFVGVQSLLEGYVNYLIDTTEGFYGSREHYFIDAIRGVFIILWASAQALVLIEMSGASEQRWILSLPIVILIAGSTSTFTINLLSGIEDPAHLLLISSIARVVGILIPMAFILGIFMINAIARPTGSRGALIIGVAFLLHAITLPFYSVAKGAGVATLGLWYAIGGIIPAFGTVYGFYQLVKEQEAVE